MGTTSFRELRVWQGAHKVVLAVYRMTREFPTEERYGLSSQMRRAAVSIPANIAEGYGRRKPADKIRFYNISEASAQELAYYLVLVKDLGYSTESDNIQSSLEEVCKMLRKLIQAVGADLS